MSRIFAGSRGVLHAVHLGDDHQGTCLLAFQQV
jgi:hypothetical protein